MLYRLIPFCFISLIMTLSPASLTASAPSPAPGRNSLSSERAEAHRERTKPVWGRVGQIFIIGNDRTRMNVILDQVQLYPGQILTKADLLEAEWNLARLGIFRNDKTTRPSVIAVDDPQNPNSVYKDIYIKVEERNTSSLKSGVSANFDGILTGSVVFEERNFDLFRLPEYYSDWENGKAFRGAGQCLRVALNYSLFRGPYISITLKGR